jgi:hypothetical protein
MNEECRDLERDSLFNQLMILLDRREIDEKFTDRWDKYKDEVQINNRLTNLLQERPHSTWKYQHSLQARSGSGGRENFSAREETQQQMKFQTQSHQQQSHHINIHQQSHQQ